MAEVAGAEEALWTLELRGGAHWSGVIRRGVTLRLVAAGDNANVAAPSSSSYGGGASNERSSITAR
jgi:hypothetical protein